MADSLRRYRQHHLELNHFWRFFLFGPGSLFFLALALIGQVATPGVGRWWTLSCFIAALIFWAITLKSAARGSIKARWSGSVMVIVLISCVFFAPATSKDVNSYALYGRMSAQYHVSPYTHEPRDFAGDVWFARTSAYWSDTPSVYGPAFTGVSNFVMKMSGTSELKARLGFQLIGAASLLGAVALLSRRIGWPLAIAGVGLNPLLDTFGVNDAHCDVLIGLAVLAGVMALEAKHYVAAGLAIAGAGLIKVSLLPALFGAFVWLWFSGKRRGAVILASSGLALIAVGFALSGGLDVLTPLSKASLRHTRFSVWNPVHIVLTDIFGGGLPTQTTADHVVSVLASIAVFGVGLTVLWRNRSKPSAVVAVVSIIAAYQVLGAYTLSWYAVWSLPVVALLLRPDALAIKPLVIVMGHGCWLAVAYLSGYGAIGVSVVLVAYVAARYLMRPAMLET